MTRRERVAHVLNKYFHNYVLADRFAGYLLRNWDEIKKEVES
jgi:hypothetical protein